MQLLGHVRRGVVGVERHHHPVIGLDVAAHLVHRRLLDRAALDQGEAAAQRVALQRESVVFADLDVDADHVALAQQVEDRRVEDDRAAMRHAALDDDVGADLPDELLHHHDVFRRLDDGDAEPRRLVADLLLPPRAREQVGDDLESLGRVDVDLALSVGRVDLDLGGRTVFEKLGRVAHAAFFHHSIVCASPSRSEWRGNQ